MVKPVQRIGFGPNLDVHQFFDKESFRLMVIKNL